MALVIRRPRTEAACESDSPSVEESSATERQNYEDDDEQSSRVHISLLYVSRVVLHVTQHAANANGRLCRWEHPGHPTQLSTSCVRLSLFALPRQLLDAESTRGIYEGGTARRQVAGQ
jgi:hypothetical protein